MGSVSGMSGMPVEEEKRTVIGVDGEVKWGAVVRVLAVEEGVNVPVRRWPFACARAFGKYEEDEVLRRWQERGRTADGEP